MPKSYTQLQKENAEKYQRLFDFFHDEHGLILTEGEIDDIIYEVIRHVAGKPKLIECEHFISINNRPFYCVKCEKEITGE